MKSRFIGLFVFVGFVTVALVGICWADKSFADGGGGWIGTGSPTYSSSGGGSGGSYYGGNVCDDDARAASYLECQGYSWIFYRYIGDAAGMKEGVVFRPDSSTNTVSSQCTQHTNGGFWHFGYNMRGIEYSDYYSVFGNWRYVRGLDDSVRVTYSTSLDGRGHAETLTRKVISPNGYYGWINGIGDGYDNHYFTHNKNELSHVIYVDGKAVYRAEKYSSNPDTNSDAAVLKDYKRACKAGGGSDSECAQIPDDAYAFCYWAGLEQGDNMGRVRILGSSSTSDNYDTFTGWKKTTDWVKTEKTIDYTVEDCSEGGCGVQFRHYLKNTKGNGTTQYKIVRSLNGVDTETFTGKKNLSDGSNDWVMSNVVTMKPGQTVCETLYWSKDENTAPGGTPYAKACVTANKTQPQGNTTTYEAKLDMTVENERTKKSGSTVYAKPGESVVYHVEYDSAPQTTVNFLLNRMRVNGGDAIIDSEAKNLNDLFNDNNGDMPDWNNRFMVFGDLFGSDGFSDGGDVGEASVGLYNIDMDNTVEGNRYEAWAEINPSSDLETWTTPSKVEITWDGNNNTTANVFTDRLRTDNTTVVVPYNFENKVEIEGYRDGDVVYAGETINDFGYRLIVGDKPNSLVDDTYATKVPGARWKFIMEYSNGDSEELDVGNGDLKSGDNIKTSPIKILDVPAGTEVCVTAQLFPRFSGNDDNIDKNNFSGISDKRVCLTVAKRPSFQVWGGNLYSGGKIDAPAATKTIKDGDSDVTRTFGSWAELALVMNVDKNKTLKENNVSMASGAGLGKSANPDDKLGGNSSAEWERYNTLTYEGSSGIPEIGTILEMLNVEESEDANSLTAGIIYGNPKGVGKKVYAVGSNFTLWNNIEISGRDTETYSNFGETPSVVIYVDGNIDIRCNVTRIDAVLIATGTINTCSDGKNDENYTDKLQRTLLGGNELVVNGALWASAIDFNRTVGARTGRESGEPAEIINYDSSFVIPGTGSVDAGRDETTLGNFVVEAVSELAPRY